MRWIELAFRAALFTAVCALALWQGGPWAGGGALARPAPLAMSPDRTADLPLAACPFIPGSGEDSPYLFGVINDQGLHYADEWGRGVRATTFELQWRLYEPAQGAYNRDYVAHMQKILKSLKDQGWYVQLVPGYHYAPDWVFDRYPDMYYTNQYGERYDPDPQTQASYRVINAPFNPQARALIAGYLARVFQDFDPGQFDSIRIGGGVQGELRYPPAATSAHFNSYWAFDAHAQNPAESGIPAEVVGWRPGIDPNPGAQGRGQRIANPGFEQAHPFLPILAWSPDDEVTARLTGTDPHGGAQALELILQTPHRIHQYLRAEPGATYRFGGWLKTGGAGLARLLVTQYDADSRPVAGAPFAKLEVGQAAWTQASGMLVASPATRFLKLELDGDRPGSYFFDDLWLARDGETDTRERDLAVPLAFYDWYVRSLAEYQDWQVAEIRKYSSARLDVLYAGKGLMPNHLNDAIANDLWGDGWSETSRALYSASAYDRLAAGLAGKPNVALYLTGIEEPARDQADDVSPYPSDWSAAHWLAELAKRHGLGIWGENTGQNSPAQMRLALERMHRFGFTGLLWAFESDLYSAGSAGTVADIEDYEAEIRRYASRCRGYLPFLRRP